MPSPTYNWNPDTRRYDSISGNAILDSTVRGWVHQYGESYASAVRTLSEKLQAGEINLPAWQIGMADAIKSSHLAAAVSAIGGKDQMTVSDWGRVGSDIKEQYQYLRSFALDIQNGVASIEGDGFLARVDQYMAASYGTYENTVLQREQDAGITQGRRVLDPASESCDDCEAAASEEFVPIEEIVEIGDSTCGARCRCWIEYDEQSAETQPGE